jgi:hypothetical protein
MEKQTIRKYMNAKLNNGDVITKETIADKIKRIAATPHVVKNRQLLKAMYHITKREDAQITCKNATALIDGGMREIIVTTVSITVDDGLWSKTLGDTIVMFPLNAYDIHTNEPPTIKNESPTPHPRYAQPQ